jgi:iron complex outermembrane receptor protein
MMLEKTLSKSIRLACLGSLTLTMHAAFAQEATGPVQQVMVTGSRLSSPNAESPSPMQVLTAADIAASGVTNLQELLLKNPTLGTPSISRTNSNFSTASAGVATIDLRNMGTARTLVLINGRRVVAGVPGSSAVDLNTIPTDFVERIELLTGGASAAYGSDAVAGVVNIILKRNFNGVVADVSAGKSSRDDDSKRKIALTFGTTSADGTSNVMGHFGFSRQGAVYSNRRDISAVDQFSTGVQTGDATKIFDATRPFNSSFAPQGRFFYKLNADTPTANYTYDRAGNPIPFSTNGSATLAATGFNRSEFRTIAVPTDRYLFATSGNLALSENHSAFFEGNYASTKVTTKLEPFPLGAESIFPASGGQVPAETLVNGVAVRNPLVPQYLYDRISDTDHDGLRDYYFTRRISEVGNRGSTADRDTFRLATGLKGALWNWNYEVYGVYGATKEAQSSGGQVNVLNFRNALQAIPGPNGTVICADPHAREQGCAPISVFGYNSITPAALAYVIAPGSLETTTTQKLLGGNVSGELFNLPAGPVGLAAGYEWRKEYSSSTPDALTQAGLNAGNATPPTVGEFDVKEFFVETRIPLLKDVPFVKSLSFLGAYRAGDYSTVGRTNSWNAGFEWVPVTDVKVRATRAVSTRAPNINELFSPPSQDFPTGINDPCVNVTATSTGTYDAACRAAPGVSANIAANGKFTLNQSDIQGISGYNRGNPLLSAEKGKSSTIGLVLTPRSIPMLSKFMFTVDYFKIDIDDAIVSTPRQFALSSCYGGGDKALCSFIKRRPAAVGANSAGSLEFIDTAVSNSGGKGTKGFDVTASWADNLGPGRLVARVAYTRVQDGYDIPLRGGEVDPFAGEIGAAKNKGSVTLGYRWGAFNLSSNTTIIGKSSLDNQFLADAFGLPPNSITVDKKIYNDFQLSYELHKKVEVYAGLDNAFDVKPPRIISGLPGSTTGAETDAGTYDAIGRRYYLGLRVKM